MRISVIGAFVALLPISLGVGVTAAAQSVDAVQPVASCSRGGNRLVRTSAGATLGAWLGFVAAKIKLSDWNDASRSASANRVRNNATIAGAVIGAVLGNVAFRGRSCAPRTAVPPTTAPPSSLRRPITLEEIEHSGINGNVYDLVHSLRRSWLNVRGIETFAEGPHVVSTMTGQTVLVPEEPQLMVYLDNARLGTISKLRELPVAGVIGVRYYDPSQATFRWGAGHSHGAIQVLMVLDSER